MRSGPLHRHRRQQGVVTLKGNARSEAPSRRNRGSVRESDLTVGRSSLKELADPGVRRLLNHVKQLVAFDSQIKVWADGLAFANAFSHAHVQLRNVERKPRRDCGWNPAIALRNREIRQRFARLRTAHRAP